MAPHASLSSWILGLSGFRTFVAGGKMAAVFARRACGLLRPVAVSLGRTASVCHLFSAVRPQRLCTFILPKICDPVPASLGLTSRSSILQRVCPLAPSLTRQPSRGITYYSVKKGKRKSCKSVPERFMRLHCGLWIRRKAGYKKKLWKKMPARRRRLREHVFCNKTQSKLLDKMTTSFWKRRNWFLNDPYLTYHDRKNLKL